jgi:uncharacterized membrane protein YccC
VGAIVAGSLCAIVCGLTIAWLAALPTDKDDMDWRVGLRRALSGADAGARFAICAALATAVALLAAQNLGVTRPYWATPTVILVMRREGMVSLKLTIHYLAGTLLGLPVAAVLWQVTGSQAAIALLATAAAASSRLGMALNPALGFACMAMFMVLASDLSRHDIGGPVPLVIARLYDVGLGGVLVIIGTLLAGAWQHHAQR